MTQNQAGILLLSLLLAACVDRESVEQCTATVMNSKELESARNWPPAFEYAKTEVRGYVEQYCRTGHSSSELINELREAKKAKANKVME